MLTARDVVSKILLFQKVVLAWRTSALVKMILFECFRKLESCKVSHSLSLYKTSIQSGD